MAVREEGDEQESSEGDEQESSAGVKKMLLYIADDCSLLEKRWDGLFQTFTRMSCQVQYTVGGDMNPFPTSVVTKI